jgi:RNA polymerase sigma-70 factor (ECF subfamily)
VTDAAPDDESSAAMTAAVYDELRRLAASYMRRERPGQTIQATALVHEAYLKLADGPAPWTNRQHFIGIAARAMRQILVDRARARGAQKRWAGMDRVSLNESLVGALQEDAMLPALDEALTRLEKLDPEQARIVELRYFVGLGIEEAADALKISPATLKRRWAMARAWLHRELSPR